MVQDQPTENILTDGEHVYVADILYPVKTLGPGLRIGIWFSGCSRDCPGCISPEMQRRQPSQCILTAKLIDMIRSIAQQRQVDGFTISGGEPFEQPQALGVLLDALSELSADILVYSGYQKAQLEELGYEHILSKIGILIDGPYVEKKNQNSFLKGSTNQQIHILKPNLHQIYDDFLANGVNKVQLFKSKTGFVTVGITKPGFFADLSSHLKEKGVEIQKPSS